VNGRRVYIVQTNSGLGHELGQTPFVVATVGDIDLSARTAEELV